MTQRTLLIATTNTGKLEEIRAKYASLHYHLIGLADLDQDIPEPEEYGVTIEENALIKATYYAEQTGYLTLADDGGVFIDALGGWPGVKSARVAETAAERITEVLSRMSNITDRSASFRVCIALYDPLDHSSHMSYGETSLQIASEPSVPIESSWGYNPILFVPELGKTYAEMTMQQKNEVSHRSKALTKMQYHLKNTYSSKTIVCPCSIIIRDGKVLLILRNDPHRPEFHRKWEFPGGSLDFGESLRDNIVREAKEETGYDVAPVHLLQHIHAESRATETYSYQVVLPLYLCSVVGGELLLADEEALDAHWVPLDEVATYDMLGDNNQFFAAVLPEIEAFLETHPL